MKKLLEQMMSEKFQEKVEKQINERDVCTIRLNLCPVCGWDGKWVHSHETNSLVCPKCRFDINDVKVEVLI